MLEGTHVAMVTDFKDGMLNVDGIRKLGQFLIDGGVNGLVPAGCTGEAATMSVEERSEMIKAVLELKKDNPGITVIPGTGTNATASSIDLTRMAFDMGADAAMLITPYYNKPTQGGLIKHYEKVASSVKIPLVLYNVPGRTGVNMLPETVAELAQMDNIVAIKEASGSIDQVSRIIKTTDLTVLSGDDSLTLPMMAVGARGVVSVAGNVAPGLLSGMVKAFLEGRPDEARDFHLKLLPLFHVLFIETNPGPVKAAVEMLGLGTGELRLPLVPVSEASREKVRGVLHDLGIMRQGL
ncbi:MAG: 4-hydroxy-tetrahydrodipicolinate synthase [bacterium]